MKNITREDITAARNLISDDTETHRYVRSILFRVLHDKDEVSE